MKKTKSSRKYLGTFIDSSNYKEILEKEGKFALNFHKKHLKAYIKGHDRFKHGKEVDKDGIKTNRPAWHTVQQEVS